MKSSQKGFTLIELVVVIVILGILAATALPKFIDLSTDARAAVVQGVEGSMRSANAMIYAKAATAGQMGATGSVTVPGGTVTTIAGFADSTAQLKNAMDLDLNKIITTGEVLSYKGYGASCGVTYTPPVAAVAGKPAVGETPAVTAKAATPPVYTTDTSGC